MQANCQICSKRFEAAESSENDSSVCPACRSEVSQSDMPSQTMRLDLSTSPAKEFDSDFRPAVENSGIDVNAGNDVNEAAEQTRTHQASSRTIGHFTIVDRLGAGQFGNVYRARDNKLERDVALKVPKEFLDESVRSVFLREARAAAQLNHPNIVGIHEVDDSEESVYLVTEFVQGLNLREWLQTHMPTFRQVAEISKKILSGLHHAHEAGVVHRDLKPANIMMDSDDSPRIMDFGLAKREIGEQPITVEGEILGTPAYMSPEQAIGNSYKVDRRADIYSFGVMLFEMLTGEKPFRGDRRILLAKIANAEPPRLRSLKSTIPVDLETITLKCLEKHPPNRYQTSQEIVDELDRYLDGQPILARPISQFSRAMRVCARFPMVTSLAVALVVSLVVGIVGISTQLIRANTERDRAEKYAEEVVRQQKETRQYLYVASMNIIQQVWDVGMIDEVRRLLDRQVPKSDDEEDIRTFEWYMFQRLYDRSTKTDSIDYQDIVSHLEAAPDGDVVAVVGEETTLQIWERNGKAPKQTLTDAPRRIANIVFSPDGNFLVAETSMSFVVWKKVNGQFILLFEDRLIDAFRVRFTKDSRWLFAQTGDRQINAWDLAKANPVAREFKNEESIKAFCLFNNDMHFLTGDDKGGMTIWNWDSGKRDSATALYPGLTNLIPPKDNDEFIFAVFKDRVVRLNLNGTTIESTVELTAEANFKDAPIRYALVSDSGKAVVVVNQKQAQILDSRRGRVKGVLDNPCEFSKWMELDSKNGLLVGIDDSKNVVNIWSDDGSRYGQLKVHNNRVYALDVSRTGEILSSGRDHIIKFSKPELARDYVEIGKHFGNRGGSWVWSLAFSDDGKFLASAADDQNVKVWNVENRELEFAMRDHGNSVQFILFSPDNRILASASRDRTIRLMNMETRQVEAILEKHTDDVNSISFSNDGKKLVSVGHDGRLIIWDLEKNQPEFEYADENDRTQLWAVIYAPDGDGIYFGGTNRKLQYLSLKGEPKLAAWELDLKFNLTSLAFSPDGKTLSATASNGVIFLIDHESQSLVDTFTGHSADAMSTAFTPDNSTLVSGCHDGHLRFWNLATKERTVAFRAHDNHIHCVRFSRDGKMLASGSWDGSVRLWLR